jgi:transcriptional enhancer factor
MSSAAPGAAPTAPPVVAFEALPSSLTFASMRPTTLLRPVSPPHSPTVRTASAPQAYALATASPSAAAAAASSSYGYSNQLLQQQQQQQFHQQNAQSLFGQQPLSPGRKLSVDSTLLPSPRSRRSRILGFGSTPPLGTTSSLTAMGGTVSSTSSSVGSTSPETFARPRSMSSLDINQTSPPGSRSARSISDIAEDDDDSQDGGSQSDMGALEAGGILGASGGGEEDLWPEDVEEAFLEALQLYPSCGRRKITLAGEGRVHMFGASESSAEAK